MKLVCFAIYDSKLEAFMTPFFQATRGLALRSFAELVNDSNHPVAKYPEDFSLWELGEFEPESGAFLISDVKNLGNAKELSVRQVNEETAERVVAFERGVQAHEKAVR